MVASVNTFEETTRGVDKVVKYGWQMRNKPGVFAWVDKHKLGVDHTYQRPLNDRKRKRIAANFNWAAFGVLTVARRPNGALVVVEGQHRLGAALSRSDVQEVPCVIHEFEGGITHEAVDFLIANKDRKALTGVESFQGQLTAGDHIAEEVSRLVVEAGRTVGDRPDGTAVRCVQALYLCASTDLPALRRIRPLVCELTRDRKLENRIVRGLHLLETRLVDEQGEARSCVEAANRNKLLDAQYEGVVRAMSEATAYYRNSGSTALARGILNLLNHRRRKLLALRGDQARS